MSTAHLSPSGGARLGIVCSGGGARAIAQVGVLHALHERGIRAGCLAGTSAGAIVAALYAAGYSCEEMLEFFETRSPFKFSKLSFGKPGIIDTAKIRADFLEYFPADSFEALDCRLFITATDIVNARLAVFESGPLISAILASSSVPLVFTPTEIGGRLFADGGIINNFPAEPLKGLCDVLLGIYVSPLRAVRPSDLSTVRAVSQRALEVARYTNSRPKFHECDVLLCPEALGDYPAFGTKHVRQIFELGYNEAITNMGTIEAALAAIV